MDSSCSTTTLGCIALEWDVSLNVACPEEQSIREHKIPNVHGLDWGVQSPCPWRSHSAGEGYRQKKPSQWFTVTAAGSCVHTGDGKGGPGNRLVCGGPSMWGSWGKSPRDAEDGGNREHTLSIRELTERRACEQKARSWLNILVSVSLMSSLTLIFTFLLFTVGLFVFSFF